MSGDATLEVRPYRSEDAESVIALFKRVNLELSSPESREAFTSYVARAIEDEIGRIDAYYDPAKGSSFWVAEHGGSLVGMFGLERIDGDSVELRRMYVSPDVRRRGFARLMLERAEEIARSAGYRTMELSTAEIQEAALALYRRSGFQGGTETVAQEQSHKTIGGGIRRFSFFKDLTA